MLLSRRQALVAALGTTVFGAVHTAGLAADGPIVAAASDLSIALPAIAALFTRRTGQRVVLTFGSSGNLTQQILNGAPFQLFLSADESYVARLTAAGRARDEGRLYAVGRIGLFAARGSPIRATPDLVDLGRAARDGRLKRLAIANPDHAPYGRAAREALTHAGLWTAIQPRLALGENVSQATQFALTGAAQAGIIPLSLARGEAVRRAGSFALIPADWHAPLRQRAVLMKDADAAARAFYALLFSAPARAILRQHGFALPGGG